MLPLRMRVITNGMSALEAARELVLQGSKEIGRLVFDISPAPLLGRDTFLTLHEEQAVGNDEDDKPCPRQQPEQRRQERAQ